MKRFIHYCNALLTLITTGMAIFTGEGALMGYVILGLFQLFVGFIYIFQTLFVAPQFASKVLLYWLTVITYFGVVRYFHPHTFIFLSLPLCIASYHCYLTYLISDQPKALINWYQRKFAHS
ncbi:MAG: hypothetical protein RLZZ500_1683 [Bacteroidota bacterium]